MLSRDFSWISLITVIVIPSLSNLTAAQYSNDEPAYPGQIPSKWAKQTTPAAVSALIKDPGEIESTEDESEDETYDVQTDATTAFIATAQETDIRYGVIQTTTSKAATKSTPGMQRTSEQTEEDNESVERTTAATPSRRKMTSVATVTTTEEEDLGEEDTTAAAVTKKQTTTAKPATTQAPSSKENSSEDEDDENSTTAGLKVTTAAKVPEENDGTPGVKVTNAAAQLAVEESDEEIDYVTSTVTPKRSLRQTTTAASRDSTDEPYEDTTATRTTLTKTGKLTTGSWKEEYGTLRTTAFQATAPAAGDSELTAETVSGENVVIMNEIVMTPKKRWNNTDSSGITNLDNKLPSEQGSAPQYTKIAHAHANVAAIPVVLPYSPSGTPLTSPAITGPFSIRDVIAIAADTRRARERIMEEQIKPNWNLALGSEIESFTLTIKSDQPYSTPTPDSTNVRQITYEIAGISRDGGRLDTAAALVRFHRLAGAAGLRDIWAIPDSDGNMVLASTIPTTLVVASAPPANPTAPEPVTVTASQLTATVVSSNSAAKSTEIVHAPANVTVIPMILPYSLSGTSATPHVITGPLSIRDVIAITAISRRSRDRIMEEQIRPNWSLALGQGIGSFKLTIESDQPYSTPSTPDGKAIRQITYQIAGISSGPLDATAALNKFHHLALAAGLHDLWAIPDSDGDLVLASIIPAVPTRLVSTSASPASPDATEPVTVPAILQAPTTLTSPAPPSVTAIVTHDGPRNGRVHMHKPKATGSLILKIFTGDKAAVQQKTAQIWSGALGVSAESVNVVPLDNSGQTGPTSTDGTPRCSYNYLLKTHPNVTASPKEALPVFIQMLSSTHLPLVEQKPAIIQSPAAASKPAGTAALSARPSVFIASEPTTTIVPLGLSRLPPVPPAYNHTLKASADMLDDLQINLRLLWSQAYGIPQNQVRVNIQGMQAVGMDQINRSISRVQYAVQITNKNETPEVVRAFQQLLQAFPMTATQNGATVKIPTETATVVYMNFLQLRRPVQPRTEAETAAPTASAWAQANARSPDAVVVNSTRVAPTVDDGGVVSSNVTTADTAAPGPQLATEEFMTEKLADSSLTGCDNCFMVPVHKVTMSKADRSRPHGSAQYPLRPDPGGHPGQPDL